MAGSRLQRSGRFLYDAAGIRLESWSVWASDDELAPSRSREISRRNRGSKLIATTMILVGWLSQIGSRRIVLTTAIALVLWWCYYVYAEFEYKGCRWWLLVLVPPLPVSLALWLPSARPTIVLVGIAAAFFAWAYRWTIWVWMVLALVLVLPAQIDELGAWLSRGWLSPDWLTSVVPEDNSRLWLATMALNFSIWEMTRRQKWRDDSRKRSQDLTDEIRKENRDQEKQSQGSPCSRP